MTQTARVWGTMLRRLQRDVDRSDRINEADRYDDHLDKNMEAYEEMLQIELEYEQDHGGVSDGQDVVDHDVDCRMDKTTEAYEEMFQYEM